MTDRLLSTSATPLPPRRALASWPFAAVLITLILMVGGPAAYLMLRAAGAPARFLSSLSQAAAEAVRPKITINQVVMNSITDLHKESKLVVLTTDISTDITREEGAYSWGFYWGTNIARVAVKNARVQYVIDCQNIGTSDYNYSPEARLLSITFPRPYIDASMVAIDPGQVQTLDLRGGWARFDKQETKDHALAELRPQVMVQAAVAHIREIAEAQGLVAATRLLQPLAAALTRDQVALRVAYRD